MEEGISGASPEEARFSIERGPAIEARNKTNNVELALEGLRKRPPTELATRDGHNLLQAAIVDQQAHQQQGEPDTKEVERLRGLDTSLAKLTAKGASELTYEQTRQLRVYF